MKTLLLLSFIGLAFGGISDDCLRCICQVEGCDSEIGKCRPDHGSPSCGPYQINEPYWIDGGRLDGDYETCAKEKECSEKTVRAYMDRYGRYCSAGLATCEDYMRMHNGGPEACKAGTWQYGKTTAYWNRAKARCGF